MSEEAKKDESNAEESQPSSELSDGQLEEAAGGIIIVDARTKTSASSLTKRSYGGPDARRQFITDEEH